MVVTDNISQPAFVCDDSSCGVLVDYFVSGQREMVAHDCIDYDPPNALWERACDHGHLYTR